MLKTGLTSVTFRNLGIEQIVSLAGAAGADSIEWGGDIHVPPGDLSAARRAAAASARGPCGFIVRLLLVCGQERGFYTRA